MNVCIYTHRFVTNFAESAHGFKLKYEVTNETSWTYNFGACGGSFTTPNGLLISPLLGDNILFDVDCIYLISQPNGTYVNITFMTMNISCYQETGISHYNEVRDGKSEASELMGKLCGDLHKVPYLHTTQSLLRIR